MKKFAALLGILALAGCAGVGFNIDPAQGDYSVTVSATDCIDVDNIVGSAVYNTPVIGPKLMAVFGCLAQ